ncbi:MAG: GNAT family N-acetyltransferase [Clostridia bacterium]|nr:GNAT family N-acetyltransferase [Clostridia bacterium]
MIRYAREKDIPRIGELLCQVDLIHHNGRPDIFKVGRKYSDEELLALLGDEGRPILVATDDEDTVIGYCFCILQQHKDDAVLTDVKTLYIDDLCVDETVRGKGIGKLLYDAAVALAGEKGCYNLTLNVWACNPSAQRFYEKCGMVPQKTYMETIL